MAYANYHKILLMKFEKLKDSLNGDEEEAIEFVRTYYPSSEKEYLLNILKFKSDKKIKDRYQLKQKEKSREMALQQIKKASAKLNHYSPNLEKKEILRVHKTGSKKNTSNIQMKSIPRDKSVNINTNERKINKQSDNPTSSDRHIKKNIDTESKHQKIPASDTNKLSNIQKIHKTVDERSFYKKMSNKADHDKGNLSSYQKKTSLKSNNSRISDINDNSNINTLPYKHDRTNLTDMKNLKNIAEINIAQKSIPSIQNTKKSYANNDRSLNEEEKGKFKKADSSRRASRNSKANHRYLIHKTEDVNPKLDDLSKIKSDTHRTKELPFINNSYDHSRNNEKIKFDHKKNNSFLNAETLRKNKVNQQKEPQHVKFSRVKLFNFPI